MMTAEDPRVASDISQVEKLTTEEQINQLRQAVKYLASRMGKHVQDEVEQAYPVLRD